MKKAFPNDTFKSQKEYFDFCFSQHPPIFGLEAYALKKEQDKRARILEPIIRPIKKVLKGMLLN